MTVKRHPAALLLAATALAVVVGSDTWAYQNFDFWEAGPILLSVGSAAALAATAVYAATRRVRLALMVTPLLSLGHFVFLLAITSARWAG
jgi:hypothetical protein